MIEWSDNAVEAAYGSLPWGGDITQDDIRMALNVAVSTDNIVCSSIAKEYYDTGWNCALEEAIRIIREHEEYSPYIVGKQKIKERKECLIDKLMDLKNEGE